MSTPQSAKRATKQQSLTSFFTRSQPASTPSKPSTTTSNGPASPTPSHSPLAVRKRLLSAAASPPAPAKKPRQTLKATATELVVTKSNTGRRPRRVARARARKVVGSDEESDGFEAMPDVASADDSGDEYAPEKAEEGEEEEQTPVEEPPRRAEPAPVQDKTPRSLLLSSFTSSQDLEATPPSPGRAIRHAAYIKKLGNPDSSLGLGRAWGTDAAADDEEAEDDEEEEVPVKKGARGTAAKVKKLTPMLQQIVDIKKKHMDTILVVEVGYKFQFFGEDARTAAKTLSIMCIPGRLRYDDHPSEAHLDRNKFAKASIPVHRLNIHLKRLIDAGHKVGVVRQLETAALKKAGDNRNAPFERKLTNLYTKGTYVDEVEETAETKPGVAPGGYLLCLHEVPVKDAAGADEKVTVGMIAVQPGTGDIIHDVFEDGFLRSELETRLLHISPCEFLLVGDITRNTEKLLLNLSGTSSNVFRDQTRIERVPLSTLGKNSTDAVTAATSHVTQYYASAAVSATPDSPAASLLSSVLALAPPALVCLSAMITHLTEYGLEHVFSLTKNFTSFTQRTHMLLTGTALESLEIYRNATDHGAHGSLFWALDKTLTRPGQRLLRKWLGRPLLDRTALVSRADAVDELHRKLPTMGVSRLETLFKSLRSIDLERSLIRIYYGKATPKELLQVLQALQRVGSSFPTATQPTEEATGFQSPMLQSAILTLPGIHSAVVAILDKIDLKAALANDKLHVLREEQHTDRMQEHQCGIVNVEANLTDQRTSIARALARKIPITFMTVSGIEYLVELANSEINRVPASWVKISGTKKVSRFHTPDVIRLLAERDRHKEALAAAADDAFRDLVAEVAALYEEFRDVVSALATMDCLLSLAKVAAQPGYVRPTILPDGSPPGISIVEGRHPIAEQTLPDGYIPFTTTLGHVPPSGTTPPALAHLITGPNMGGKSSFVRAVALLSILAQTGSFVPATSLTLSLLDAIHTRMGAHDNLFAGESTFMLEVSETSRILRTATPRSLIILDELGRGTSTHDGAALAEAVLTHVATTTRCLTLFITHYQNLARVANALAPAVRNVHMRFEASKDAQGQEVITFLYEVADGVAHRSYGLNVARLARVPAGVLEVARLKSREMELEVGRKRLGAAVRALGRVVSGDVEGLEYLVRSIDEL